MKYGADLKIEYCYEKCGVEGKNRYFYYRIKPPELPFWKRWFFNPWRKVFHAYSCLNGYNYLFDYQEYRDELLPIKTFGEMCDYLHKQNQIIEDRHRKKIQKCEAWPDEY